MDRIRLGMLTPSSNTVLEPVTTQMLAAIPQASAHFARFRVTRIALTADALAQFDPAPVLEAASLLADARVHVIAWSGTSAGWLGLESDRRLVAGIEAATGTRATTAVLALETALERLGARRIGLLTPYTGDVQARIVANYAARGIEVVAEEHLDDPGNFSFASYEEPELLACSRRLAAARPDAIVTLCTNLRASGLAETMEASSGIPYLDSIAATVWRSLELAGAPAASVCRWGRIFGLT